MHRLKHKLLLKSNRNYRKIQTATHKLNYLFWECTLRCNLNCLHCGSDCHVNSAVKDMPATDFLKVIDKLPEICNPNETLIVLTGGEPLVRKDIAKVGLQFYKRGFPWGMVTNGLLLNKTRLNQLLDAGMRTLTISLDGLEDSHNWLRNIKGAFNKTLKAIELAAGEKDLEFDIVSCVNPRNLHELPELAKLLISKGVKSWRLFSIFPKGRAELNSLVLDNPNDVKYLMDFIEQTRAEGKIMASFGCEGFLGNYEYKVRSHGFFCRAGITVGSVLADGSISACPSLDKEFIQGNIYTDDFNDVWQNRYQIYRNKDWAKTGICKNCKQWNNCLGNGLHLRNPEQEGPLYCHYKMLFP